ncbi:hypothetical protein MJO52_14055 [Microbulbifer variabilis]|uniref:Uncharacterized protein n=1 Tax=Microbulbifer variabilis TaxID=266805 RepID=A0ABY4V7F4_9GAMM|nr:hypothetical protein [Microbulbifer variabilis]USD20200.1 hypothetical protein MJO52_14055 [Microbulbifer variabilis]
MKLSQLLLGARKFASQTRILKVLKSSEYFDHSSENIKEVTLLLIFKTSTQRSWLAFSNHKIYFILDDLSRELPEVRWRRIRQNIISNNRITLDLKLEEFTENTGRVNIGRMNKGFLYSKSLFLNEGIKKMIFKLIQEKMLNVACKN